MAVLVILGFLAVFSFVGFAIWACGFWILRPLDRAAKNRQYPVQFSLADLLCLFVLVQLPLGALHWAERETNAGPGLLGLDIMLVGAAIVAWWTCLRTLSRAGIHIVWQRCVILTVAMPVGLVGGIAALFLLGSAWDMLHQQHILTGCFLLLAEAVLVGSIYGLGRFTRAVVGWAEAGRNEPPSMPREY